VSKAFVLRRKAGEIRTRRKFSRARSLSQGLRRAMMGQVLAAARAGASGCRRAWFRRSRSIPAAPRRAGRERSCRGCAQACPAHRRITPGARRPRGRRSRVASAALSAEAKSSPRKGAVDAARRGADQAAASAARRFRRQAAVARPPKPISSIAQVEGSGTGLVDVKCRAKLNPFAVSGSMPPADTNE
jgi:hypothetical protein